VLGRVYGRPKTIAAKQKARIAAGFRASRQIGSDRSSLPLKDVAYCRDATKVLI
jgi:hypothetical protein